MPVTFKIVQPTKTPGWVKEVEFLPDAGAGGSLFIFMRLLVAVVVVTLRNSGLLSHVNTTASSPC